MPDDGSGGFVYFRSGAEREADVQAEPKSASLERKPSVSGSVDDYPEDGTIPEVKDWIDGDTARAQEAYDREQDRPNPRTTLLDYLSSMLFDDNDDSDA